MRRLDCRAAPAGRARTSHLIADLCQALTGIRLGESKHGGTVWPFGPSLTLADVAKPLPPEELKRLTQIVVVDDEQDSFPTTELKASGYRVDYWPRLDATGLRRLEQGEYDIVVLDIQGIVAPGFSDTGDGLGVLRRLKRCNPAQVVVAFSGQSYNLDSMEFYRLADATLSKPVKTIGCMELLDELMQSRVGAAKYWNGIASILASAGVPAEKIRRLEHEVAKAAKKGTPLTVDRIEGLVGHIGTLATVAELLKKVVELATGSAS